MSETPSKEELLARATGKARSGQKVFRTPPPAKMPGVRGNPPLPQGKVVSARRPSSLTAEERSRLEAIGWDDSMPIPRNMAAILKEIEAEQLAREENLPPPVDPRTPPLKPPEAVPVERLDAAGRERLRTLLTRAVEAERAEDEERAANARMSLMPQDMQLAYQMASAPPARPPEIDVDVEAEEWPEPGEAPPEAAPPREAPPRPAAAAAGDTGAGGRGLTHCPHCLWNLDMPDIAEPSYAKKIAFLHSILGQKCFIDEAELFGGAVVATFRSLTTQEIEVAYKQAYLDNQNGRAPTEMDFYERINRYRLFTQLQGLRTTGDVEGFVHNLPDGLDRQTNQLAAKTWGDLVGNTIEAAPDGETILPSIEKYVTGRVLRTEALFRVVNAACNQFNRLVAKLEALVDNSDFWKPTGAPS